MIICEGPDGAGKSSLCQMLKAASVVNTVLESPRLAAKGNVDRMKYETKRYLKLYALNNGVAVDRFLFSEMVYGSVIRKGSAFSKPEYLDTVLALRASGSYVIFCLPDKFNFKPDESPYLIERMPELVAEYEKYFDNISPVYPRCIKYKWDEPNAFQNLVQTIEKGTL